MSNNYMVCPSCGTPVEKISGCNHMTCPECKGQYCYLCGSKWAGHCQQSMQCYEKRMNFDHSSNCLYLFDPYNDIINEKLTVFVKTIDSKTITVQARSIESVGRLKEKISLMTNVQKIYIHLVYGKYQLIDDFDLGYYHIKNGETINCIRRQYGGY